MTQYTSNQIAEMTGRTRQAISRYAQNHPGIGVKYGRDWLFSEEDYRVLLAVHPGRPRKTAEADRAPAAAVAVPDPAEG